MGKQYFVSRVIPKKYMISRKAFNSELDTCYAYLRAYLTIGDYSQDFVKDDMMRLFSTYRKLHRNVKSLADALFNTYKIGVKWKVLSECMQTIDKIWAEEQKQKADEKDKEITKQEETKEPIKDLPF